MSNSSNMIQVTSSYFTSMVGMITWLCEYATLAHRVLIQSKRNRSVGWLPFENEYNVEITSSLINLYLIFPVL